MGCSCSTHASIDVASFPLPVKPVASRKGEVDQFVSLCRDGERTAVRKALQKDPELIDAKGSEDGSSGLIVASASGFVELVSDLLQGGADVEIQRDDGSTSLIAATRGGHFEVVQLLTRAGAEVDVQDAEGKTALYFAAQVGSLEIAFDILRAGAAPNLQISTGGTALTIAAIKNHATVADLLIGHDAETESRGVLGLTPMHWAVQNGNAEVVDLLISRGATLDSKTDEGETPFMIAQKYGHRQIAILLQDEGGGLRGTFWREDKKWALVMERNWACISRLCAVGAVALWPFWVLQLFQERRVPVPKRQKIEAEVRRLAGDPTLVVLPLPPEGTPATSGFQIVCLSYAWLDSHHPDPDLYHLDLVVKEVKRHWWGRPRKTAAGGVNKKSEEEEPVKVWVFWDFISLFQSPRTEEQEALFRLALSQMEMLYSSLQTRVFRSIGVPPTAANQVPFSERGWPTFETFVTGFNDPCMIHNLADMNAEKGETRAVEHRVALSNDTDFLPPVCGWSPTGSLSKSLHLLPLSKQDVLVPSSPLRFDQVIEQKIFTNGGDKETVTELYRQFVEREAGMLTKISFAGRVTFGDPEAETLSGFFHFILFEGKTRSLFRPSLADFSLCTLTDVGGQMLVAALAEASGLQRLTFAGCPFVSLGTASALDEAFGKGGFAHLSDLSFAGCERIDDSCAGVLQRVLSFKQREKRKIACDLMRTSLSSKAVSNLRKGLTIPPGSTMTDDRLLVLFTDATYD